MKSGEECSRKGQIKKNCCGIFKRDKSFWEWRGEGEGPSWSKQKISIGPH